MTRDEVRSRLTDQIALTCTLDAEARGEQILGQIAVGSVIRNRLSSGRFGRSYASVCLARLQFSCWWGEDANSDRCYAMAEGLLNETPEAPQPLRQISWVSMGIYNNDLRDDPTMGASHYLTRDLYRRSTVAWAVGRPILAEIGSHVFLRAL